MARGYADFPGAVLAIQRAILVADHYLRAIQQLGDCLQQGFAVGRFADEAGGAELQRGVEVAGAVAGGEDGDGRHGVGGAQFLQQCQTAAVGQLQVQQDQVVGVFTDLLEGFGGVVGVVELDAFTERAKGQAQAVEVDLVVINQQ